MQIEDLDVVFREIIHEEYPEHQKILIIPPPYTAWWNCHYASLDHILSCTEILVAYHNNYSIPVYTGYAGDLFVLTKLEASAHKYHDHYFFLSFDQDVSDSALIHLQNEMYLPDDMWIKSFREWAEQWGQQFGDRGILTECTEEIIKRPKKSLFKDSF